MDVKTHKIFSISSLISNIFVPTLVLTVYSGLLGIILNHYHLVGVNQIFIFRLIEVLIYIISFEFGGIIVMIIINLIKKGKFPPLLHDKIKFSPSNLFLLLLPLTPVIQYIIKNIEILSTLDVVVVFFFFFLFSALLVLVLPNLLGFIGNIRIMKAVGLAFTFTIFLMPYLSQLFNWFKTGNFVFQLSFFLSVFLITLALIGCRFRKMFFAFLIINFTVNTAFQFFSPHAPEETKLQITEVEEYDLLATLVEKTPEITPDIFFLIYEAYTSDETLMAYGFNNQAQEAYLQDKGFKIYPDIYSVGSPTINSLSRVFNISSTLFPEQRRGIAGDGVVQNILKNLDYKMVGYVTSNWIYRGYGSKYDSSYPNAKIFDSDEMLISAILIGEFQSDLFFDVTIYDDFIQEKRTVFEYDSTRNTFAYIHSAFPGHSQVSGGCLSNEIELYLKRLEIANIEMQEDIEILLQSHPDAIIIIAGDHGPYITNSCYGLVDKVDLSEISRLDIQDRFATFLAIKWPTTNFEDFDEIMVLQDIFPAVFAYMYKDGSLLETKILPDIMDTQVISGATVKSGIIFGGVDDGQPLFDLAN